MHRTNAKLVQDTNRVVNTLWNSLHNKVVRAESTNIFKTSLDEFRSNQKILYDYHA